MSKERKKIVYAAVALLDVLALLTPGFIKVFHRESGCHPHTVHFYGTNAVECETDAGINIAVGHNEPMNFGRDVVCSSDRIQFSFGNLSMFRHTREGTRVTDVDLSTGTTQSRFYPGQGEDEC